jgi:hypothetical protein
MSGKAMWEDKEFMGMCKKNQYDVGGYFATIKT